MKETNDTAMDLLLRRLAQRSAPPSAPGEARLNEGLLYHLDADELSAFAENALPEAARTRYAAHLSDCDSCRKLATELTMTASVAAQIERASAPDKSLLGSIGQMLAALFSFPVLRYGVPALTMFALVAVAFVVLRQRERGEFVTQNEPSSSAEKQVRLPITASPESSPDGAVAPRQKQDGEETSASVAPAKDFPKEKAQPAKSDLASPGYAGAANVQQPGFAPEPNAASNERDEKSRNAPVAAAPAKSAPSNDLKLADKAPADELARVTRNTETTRNEEQIAKRNRDVGPAPPPKSGIAAGETKSKGGPRRAREQSESEGRSSGTAGARTSEVSPETRKVSGHTFRLQSSTWVDVVYSSSIKLTTLTRGSEKYWSIVNDEPGLRAIAEQLGDVIVVWNGKAYRIH